jgi:hypothetical protein
MRLGNYAARHQNQNPVGVVFDRYRVIGLRHLDRLQRRCDLRLHNFTFGNYSDVAAAFAAEPLRSLKEN